MPNAEHREPRATRRVLLVASSFGAYGGTEAVVLTLAEDLAADRRFEVKVCFKQAAGFELDAALAESAAVASASFCHRGGRELWHAIQWADIVHAHTASPDIALMATADRKPLALSIHNVLPRNGQLRRLSWRLASRLASIRWYNSHFVWDTWESDGARLRSACVYPSSHRWHVHRPPEQRRGFVFVGRLVRGKGAEVLLEAYARAALDPELWPLTIVGDGPLRPEVTARAQQLGTSSTVTGFVNGLAKAETLSRAKWLVVPSHWQEPFGLVAHEARSVGVPCIVTRDGGLPEAAGRDALICEPDDMIGLATVLRRAADMPEEEYVARARRTKSDLETEAPPPTFYQDAYLKILQSRRARVLARI